MNNPESGDNRISEGGITVRTSKWEFPQYVTPRDYQGKQVKPGLQKATKKGFYMDYMLKVSKCIPSAQQYKTQSYWSQPKENPPKRNQHIKRNSYIDQIQQNYKKKKSTPGVGAYKLMPQDKQIQEKNKKYFIISQKRQYGSKRFFHEDISFISNTVPGPGNYNPHEITRKQIMNKTDPNFWKNKHIKQMNNSIKSNKIKPDPALYHPNYFGTFQNISKQTASKSKSNSKAWGSSSRFIHYEKVQKKNPNKQKRPSPTSYDMSIIWKGKNISKNKANEKKKDWLHSISKARNQSIYH